MELSMKPQDQITNITRAMDLIDQAQELLENAGLVAESSRIDAIVDELEHEADYIAATEFADVEPRRTVGIHHNF